MGWKARNKVDVVLDRDKFKALLEGMSVKDFYYEKLIKKWEIGLSYKSFLNLVNNRVGWRLLHAWAIVDVLKCDVKDIFKVSEVNEKEREKRRKIERRSKIKAMANRP